MIFDQSRNITLHKLVKRKFLETHTAEEYKLVRILAFVDYVNGVKGKCAASDLVRVLGLSSNGRISQRLYLSWCAGYLKQKVDRSRAGAGRKPRVYWLSKKGASLLLSFSVLFDEVEREIFYNAG